MLRKLKEYALRTVFQRYFQWRLEELTDGKAIVLDYAVDPVPRYPLGRTAHAGLHSWFEAQRSACTETLELISRYRAELEAIPRLARDSTTPYWDNTLFSALDGMALYAILAHRQPARMIEVGSGNSTKFAAQAIRDHKLPTRLLSIDPQPRAEIDSLCSRVLRQPLERVDVAVFADLKAGDILFIDNSHRAFTNSDVTTFFLEVLPRVPAGVLLHIHDIFLPWDYPEEWRSRYYSEQYLLACWLLAGPGRCKLQLSNAFVSFDPALRDAAGNAWAGSPLGFLLGQEFRYGGVAGLMGTSFWAEVASPQG